MDLDIFGLLFGDYGGQSLTGFPDIHKFYLWIILLSGLF
jgi:hypothetical protein